jgi:hypothetical protein
MMNWRGSGGPLPEELWIDGKRAGVYANLTDVAASPDGGTLAWNARRFATARLAVDGVESDARFDKLSNHPPTIGPDGVVHTIGIRGNDVLAVEARTIPLP